MTFYADCSYFAPLHWCLVVKKLKNECFHTHLLNHIQNLLTSSEFIDINIQNQ